MTASALDCSLVGATVLEKGEKWLDHHLGKRQELRGQYLAGTFFFLRWDSEAWEDF